MTEYEMAMNKLKSRLANRLTKEGSFPTLIEGVAIHRRNAPTLPKECFASPEIMVLVQGCKRSVFGAKDYFCGEGELLISGLDLPNTSSIINVEPGKPALSMTIELNKSLIAQLALEMMSSAAMVKQTYIGLMVQPLELEMLDAFLRLEALLNAPEQIPILAPMVIKEMHFRLLIGPHGGALRALHTFGTQKNQVVRAVTWIRDNYIQPMNVDALAEMVHMATGTFHRQFKAITSLSPLQFQKRLRLQEAHRLLITEDLDISSACEIVGYESVTQFNREYRRLFGEPPRRNVTRWKNANSEEQPLARAE